MRKLIGVLLATVMAALFAACGETSVEAGAASEAGSLSEAPAGQVDGYDALGMVHEMMGLDYEAMPVASFNRAIQEIAGGDEPGIFAVIAEVWDDWESLDAPLAAFMRGTLTYSSGEIFGEPVYIGHVSYILVGDATALEMHQRAATMDATAYDAYFDEILGDIDLYTTVAYHLFFEVADEEAMTVGERDTVLAAVRDEIDTFVLALAREEITAPDIEDVVEAKLGQLNEAYSDDSITIRCVLERVESIGEI